jgi:hypothetical protein
VCNAFTGHCTCPAGWRSFNCIFPQPRYCTHEYRQVGFVVERTPPNWTQVEAMDPRTHCVGERQAQAGREPQADCGLRASSLPPLKFLQRCLPEKAALLPRSVFHSGQPDCTGSTLTWQPCSTLETIALQASAMRRSAPATALQTQRMAAYRRPWTPPLTRPPFASAAP